MDREVRILVECPELIASVRVGVLEPLKPLEVLGKCNVKFKKTRNIDRQDIAWCDVLISVRGCEYSTYRIIEAAKKAGRYIIYFLDDDLLNIPTNISSSDFLDREELKKSLIACITNSNILWCVNKLIGETYGKYCNNQWVLSKVPTEIRKKRSASEKMNILYAGSVDHEKNVQTIISPAVRKLCDEFGDEISFTFIGANPRISEYKNVRFIKFIKNYDCYKRIVDDGDYSIGLAIINTTNFYKCKYYNKFIEYTTIGAIGVYTNSEPYSVIIEDEKNGFLCENSSDAWYEAIRKIVLDKGLMENCIRNAQEIVDCEHNSKRISEDLEKLIPELTGYFSKDINYKIVKLHNMKMEFYKGRAKFLFDKHGILFVFVIMYKAVRKIVKYLFYKER